VRRLRLQMVVVSHVLQSLGTSSCPGLWPLVASADLLRMAPVAYLEPMPTHCSSITRTNAVCIQDKLSCSCFNEFGVDDKYPDSTQNVILGVCRILNYSDLAVAGQVYFTTQEDKSVRPSNTRTEMYASRVACCRLVSHVEYAPSAVLRLGRKIGQTDGRTDGRTDARPLHYAYC